MSEETIVPSNLVIYEVFVRNHSEEGSFGGVEQDLERIRSMGVDVIWLMPIHPVGRRARKGALGSPYSISNYREVNPEYGTTEDFQRLVRAAHRIGLKVMIDVVYNHTSHDSILVEQHPDWFHCDETGRPIPTVPEWSDVVDLKYPNSSLEEYLIESLLGWSRMGVDGFRCDVASLVPVDFWMRARAALARERPDTLWLAESVHTAFVGWRRAKGLPAHSDGELFAAFDLEYDYDLYPIWQAAVTGRVPAARYLEMARMQGGLYPANAVKMHCVENHDQRRIMSLAPAREQALAWTAFEAFNAGAFLVYAGQESGATRTPSLFDPDPVQWGGYELQPWLTRLIALKREPAVVHGRFTVSVPAPLVVASWESESGCLLGVFNVETSTGEVETGLADGDYEELLTARTVAVKGGRTEAPASAMVLRYERPIGRGWFYSDLLDFSVPAND